VRLIPTVCDWGCKKNSQSKKEIREMSARLGHVPIIDDNPGQGEKREFSPAEAVRYRERSAVERVRIAHGRAVAASDNPVLNAGKGGVCPKITIPSQQRAQ